MDRGRERLAPSPPSEPGVQFSRDGALQSVVSASGLARQSVGTAVMQLLRAATTPSVDAGVRFSSSGGLAPRKYPYDAGLRPTSYASVMESVSERVMAGSANAAMHTPAPSFASHRRLNDE
jgi:hypothetical protein